MLMQNNVKKAKKLAQFFQIEITIRLFGMVIWHKTFPPSEEDPVIDEPIVSSQN